MPKSIEEILNETLAPEMKATLQDAFEARVAEVRAEITESVSVDMAARYEHDKNELVEAMDKMLTDVIRVHEEAKAVEINRLVEARKNYQNVIKEHKAVVRARIEGLSTGITSLVSESIGREVQALRAQKAAIAAEAAVLSENIQSTKLEMVANHEKHLEKVNEFVVRQIAKELKEFAQDKRALVETRVKLVTENKAKLAEAQKKFIKEAASKVEQMVNETMTREVTALHEDIETHRKNQLGMDIFNAFAATYMSSHLVEGTEIRKLQKMLESKDEALRVANEEADSIRGQLNEATSTVEAANRKVALAEERSTRKQIMTDLLANLRGEKRSVMESMLETTKTAQLRSQFDKLLPVVLSDGRKQPAAAPKKAIAESAEAPRPTIVAGDRPARIVTESAADVDPMEADILRLAGLGKQF